MATRLILGAAAISLLTLGSAGIASAGFPEKNITFLIPFAPGGGMDSTARQVAKSITKYLPNKVNVVTKNVPGAGGRKGYNALQRATPDGYTISVINMPGAMIPHLTGEKVSFKIDEFVWIGRMSTSPYFLGVNKDSSIKKFSDIKAAGIPLKTATTGYGSTAYVAAAITAQVADFKVNFLTGYKGSKQYILGVIRGDAIAALAPTQTFFKFVKSGDIRGIVSFELKSSFGDVPTIADVGFPELTGLGVERLVAAPPGTPDSVAKILSDAMGKAIADADSQAWAKKSRRPFSYVSGPNSGKAIKKMMATFQKYPDALKKQ